MIEADKRNAIFLLHQEGMELREIARRFDLNRNTVREIIKVEGKIPNIVRKDKIEIDPELLRKLYQECDGRAQRVHEKLIEEEKIQVGYSTLTRMLSELEISKPPKTRCDRVPDKPGEEMQHDTSPYVIEISGKLMRVTASLIYLRYSKKRYLKFYRAFNRFLMKCFLHEALGFWGYSATNCIIDNTNLARLIGTGKNAIIVPEMEAFGKQRGFEFHCHEIKHSNRKAGEERSFWTVETNFFPGRTFESLEDLNQQALEWSTKRMEHRAQTKAKIIPAKAFEFEISFLNKLPPFLPAPYQSHERCIDQYGYLSFDGNYYWVPGTGRGTAKVLEYSASIKIYQARECLAEYSLPPNGVKNRQFSPEGSPPPRYKPKYSTKPTEEEEKRLRAIDERVNTYLDFALKTKSKGIARHNFLRKLTALSRKITPELFIKSIERALKYRITSIDIVQNIALLHLGEAGQVPPFAELDEDFEQRESYQEGSLTEQPDLTIYDTTEEQEDE